MHRLFVDVGYELSENQLRQHFTRYGAVSDVYLPKHSMGRNKGYAFVTFTSEQALSQALLDTQPVVDGIKLKVKRATPRPPGKHEPNGPSQFTAANVPSVSAKVFVEGLAPSVTEVQVHQHFGKWGIVTHVAFCMAQHDKDCIVTFDSHIAAKRACDQSERFLDGQAIKSISLMGTSSRERTHSHSLSSGSSEANSGKAGLSAPSHMGGISAADGAGSLAANESALMAARLRLTNPSAYATWLHLEQLQQQLLAENAPSALPPHLQHVPKADSGQFSSPKAAPQHFGVDAAGASPYSLPYQLPAGYAPSTDSPQPNLETVLSRLYSQPSAQTVPEFHNRFSQSAPYSAGLDSMYSQPAQSTANSEGLKAYLNSLQGVNSPVDQGQIDSTNYLRSLAQRAVVAAGTPGLDGRLEDMKSAESKYKDVPMQDHVQSNYSLPRWTPF